FGSLVFKSVKFTRPYLPNRYAYVTLNKTTLSSSGATGSGYWTRDYFTFVAGSRFADAVNVEETGETTEAGVPVVASTVEAGRTVAIANTASATTVSATP
ncbi:hypothetical protein PZH32_13035, partial [Adlercreutzia equolifaciens]|uniref:hypothetical protein n=1 Tax=Adlercreutzia equolifaciens TaxID=446660 RepID=UPI0023B1BE61